MLETPLLTSLPAPTRHPPIPIRALRGVYRPQEDTQVLAERIADEGVDGADVLDVCTGTGTLATVAGVHGARSVTAVDHSRRAVATARVNLRANGVPARVLRGDLFGPVAGRRFDVIVSNPPYVPSAHEPGRRPNAASAWDAGHDGRLLLDRICAAAPRHLRPGGRLLLVHSALADGEATVDQLLRAGLDAAIVHRTWIPFGPVMRARQSWLQGAGHVDPGQELEELVVVRAVAPSWVGPAR